MTIRHQFLRKLGHLLPIQVELEPAVSQVGQYAHNAADAEAPSTVLELHAAVLEEAAVRVAPRLVVAAQMAGELVHGRPQAHALGADADHLRSGNRSYEHTQADGNFDRHTHTRTLEHALPDHYWYYR